MNFKYKTCFKTNYKGYKIELRKNKSQYVFMYGKKTHKDFDRKAKRVKDKSLLKIIKTATSMYMRGYFNDI